MSNQYTQSDFWCPPTKTHRWCRHCRLIKPVSCFYKNKATASGYCSPCKPCKDKEDKNSKTNRRDHPIRGLKLREYGRWGTIKYKYGFTKQQYEDMYKLQDGKCGICGRTDAGHVNGNDKLRIDHCHKTRKFRGLLCHKCNLGIGEFKDDLVLLRKAVIYLERFNDANNENTKAIKKGRIQMCSS